MRAALGSLVALAALPAAALTPLPTLPGDTMTVAQDVSAKGVVVGYGQDAAGAHPLRWRPGAAGPDTLPLPAGVTFALANGVNKQGAAVGVCIDAVGSAACAWDPNGAVQKLPGFPGSTGDQAMRVNDAGLVAGQSTATLADGSSQVHAVLWAPGQPARDLGTLAGGDFSQALDVNQAGDAVGVSSGSDAGGPFSHAVLWRANGTTEDLGTLPGDFTSTAVGINSAGLVAGYSMGFSAGGDFQLRSFVWTASGGLRDLGSVPGSTLTQALDVGDGGQVVGTFYDASGTQHAFQWTEQSGIQDLGTLTGGSTSSATAVNQYGTVVGQADSGQGGAQAFVLDRQPQGDDTAPVSAAQVEPAPNAAGWNRTDVLVHLSATDADSGVREIRYTVNGGSVQRTTGAQASVALSGDGAWAVAHQAVDKAGNEESWGAPLGVRIDTAAPQLSARLSGSAQNGWYRSPVTVTFDAADQLSGLAFVTAPVQLSSEGANQAATGVARDVADNEASTVVGGIGIDLSAPQLTLALSRTELWPPNHQLVPVQITGKVSDALSGVGSLRLGIQSSQPDDADGDGSTRGDVNGEDGFGHPVMITVTPDAQGRFSAWVQLRAERSEGQERTYTVSATAQDRAGNAARTSAQVRVAPSKPKLRSRR